MMQIEILLGLKDVPGMLVKALEPISRGGGNIVTVYHSRGSGEVVDVNVVFKVKDQKTLDVVLDSLKGDGIQVKSVKAEGHRYYSKRSISFILIGHVIDQDIQDTIDRINKLGLVRGVDVNMSDPTRESAVMMYVDVDEDKAQELMKAITQISAKKNFMLIREVTL